eukprot:2005243-Rhodomonas_salina.1
MVAHSRGSVHPGHDHSQMIPPHPHPCRGHPLTLPTDHETNGKAARHPQTDGTHHRMARGCLCLTQRGADTSTQNRRGDEGADRRAGSCQGSSLPASGVGHKIKGGHPP